MTTKSPAKITWEIAVQAAKDAFNAGGACGFAAYDKAKQEADAAYRTALGYGA